MIPQPKHALRPPASRANGHVFPVAEAGRSQCVQRLLGQSKLPTESARTGTVQFADADASALAFDPLDKLPLLVVGLVAVEGVVHSPGLVLVPRRQHNRRVHALNVHHVGVEGFAACPTDQVENQAQP